MRRIIRYAVILLLILNIPAGAQNTGEALFKATCTACHTIGKGKLIGPDLSGVYNKMKPEWLTSFIKSSQKMVKAGDPDAVAIFNEFLKIPMPDNNLTDNQILSILNYIKETDLAPSATPPVARTATDTSVTQPVSPAQIAAQAGPDTTGMNYSATAVTTGGSLFRGYSKFINGASPCIVCHNINDESVLGGGKLGLDLTGSYLKLGPAGIRAILSAPPFPVMQNAFLNQALQPDEINALLSLFRSISENPTAYQTRKSAGLFLFAASFICAVFIIAFIYVLYDNRKIPYLKPVK